MEIKCWASTLSKRVSAKEVKVWMTSAPKTPPKSSLSNEVSPLAITSSIKNLVGTGLVQLFGGVFTAIIAFFILIQLNASLTLYTLAPLALFGLISLRAFGYIRPVFRERGKINADVTGRLTESLGGIRVIKGFNAEKHEISIFEKGVHRIFENVKKSMTVTSLITALGTLLIGSATVGLMWMGGFMIIDGKMTVGDLFAFISFLAFLIAPFVQMGNIGSQITESLAGLDRTEEILREAPESENKLRINNLNNFQGNVSFEDVTVARSRLST